MADPKKGKDKPAPKAKAKLMSKQDCKKTRGGMASLVSGGLAGPELVSGGLAGPEDIQL